MDSFYEEEKNCVSDMMRRVWEVELDLLRQFDEVCQKYSLKYYAGFGTLLGAVRHHGFIPWDDDIDLFMLRDEYEKLKIIAKDEFKGKYYFQDWYNSCGRTWIFSKLRNSETTAVEYPEKGAEFNQGIFIDIFPIDEFDDGIHVNAEFKKIQKELFNCINNPIDMLKGILEGKQYTMDIDSVISLSNDYIRAQHLFDQLTLENFGQSDIVGYFYDEMRGNDRKYPKSVFDEVIYLPFENTTVPVPKEYDIILSKYYGDYMTPVKEPNNHQGRIILDPYKPYTEYLL